MCAVVGSVLDPIRMWPSRWSLGRCLIVIAFLCLSLELRKAPLRGRPGGAVVFGTLSVVASDQVGLPAELKHISKRRKRN